MILSFEINVKIWYYNIHFDKMFIANRYIKSLNYSYITKHKKYFVVFFLKFRIVHVIHNKETTNNKISNKIIFFFLSTNVVLFLIHQLL